MWSLSARWPGRGWLSPAADWRVRREAQHSMCPCGLFDRAACSTVRGSERAQVDLTALQALSSLLATVDHDGGAGSSTPSACDADSGAHNRDGGADHVPPGQSPCSWTCSIRRGTADFLSRHGVGACPSGRVNGRPLCGRGDRPARACRRSRHRRTPRRESGQEITMDLETIIACGAVKFRRATSEILPTPEESSCRPRRLQAVRVPQETVRRLPLRAVPRGSRHRARAEGRLSRPPRSGSALGSTPTCRSSPPPLPASH